MLDDFIKLQRITRRIIASLPEVEKAVDDLKTKLKNKDYALCGGLAAVIHGYVRNTQDIDILIKSETELTNFKNLLSDDFKETRTHAMEHKKTGVEIELLTPEFLKQPDAKSYVDRAINEDGFKFVNLIDFITMKLNSNRNKDKVDVEYVMKNKDVNEVRKQLDENLLEKFDKIMSETDNELKD